MADTSKGVAALRKTMEREVNKGDPQYALAEIQKAMGCVGISQCALDVADEAIKRIAERDALQAKLDAMPGKLRDIIRMTDEIGKAPMTADRWADRIEEVALEMIASINGDDA